MPSRKNVPVRKNIFAMLESDSESSEEEQEMTYWGIPIPRLNWAQEMEMEDAQRCAEQCLQKK
jgi:hypothetical protein